MTLEAMQRHESVTLRTGPLDYRRQGVVRLLKDHVQGEAVLDMRCLSGDLIIELARNGHQVVGLDAYAGAVEEANAAAETAGLPAPIAHLWELANLQEQAAGRSFDCVICVDLLNHVASDVETIAEIHDVLRPGGRCVFLVPAFPALLGKRDASLGHLRRYTKPSITNRLNEAGLHVVRCRYWNFLALPGYVLIEKILHRTLSDRIRYGPSRPSSHVAGPLLRWWYRHVERLVSPPIGLSLLVVAEKAP